MNEEEVTISLTQAEIELLVNYALRKLLEEEEAKYKTAALFKEKP